MANQDFRVKNGLQVGLGASVVGIVTAESFSGSAVGLTSVPSSSLTGTISTERLSGTYNIDISGTVSGNSINVGSGDTGVFANSDGTLLVTGIATFKDRVIFDSTNSIQVPVGTESEKDAVGTAVTGQIRYNTTNSQFEGFGPGNDWGSLGGVKDVDGDTYVKPESSPGSDEDALTFFTAGTERAVIDSNGKVGIGTTNPSSRLEVYESSGTDIRLNTAVNNDNSITFAEGNTNFFRILHDGSGLSSPNNLFKIQTATGSSGINNDAITIKQSGNIGIGSTQPTSTLDLDGTLKVSGVSTFLGDVNIGTGGTTAFFDVSSGKVGIGTSILTNGAKLSLPTLTGFDGDALFSAGNQLSDYSLWVLNDSANADPSLRQKYVRQLTFNHYTISVGSSKAFRVSNSTGFSSDIVSAPGGASDTDVAFVVNPNTSTELRYNYNKKLETTGYGVSVYGGLDVSGISTFNKISAGSTTGTDGQYLKSTGVGVTWADFPVVRTGFSTIATAGQTGFSTSYNVGFIDVYVNGIRLTDSEFTANDGTNIGLSTACFGGEYVDIIAYSTISTGSGGGGGGSGSGSSATRSSETLTIGSISSGVTTTGTITLPKTGVMISIHPVGDASGWLRLYTRSDLAAADASRARTQDPDSGSGVILETITSGISTVYLSPQTIFANAEDTPINTFNYRFTKDGSAGITTFTFKYLSLES